MIQVPGRFTSKGSQFARQQFQQLLELNLNEERAHQLIERSGPSWSVATFICYKANRRRFTDRNDLLQLLQALHTEGMERATEFYDRMRLMGLIPIEQKDSPEPLRLDDCDRILNALRFFAQRY